MCDWNRGEVCALHGWEVNARFWRLFQGCDAGSARVPVAESGLSAAAREIEELSHIEEAWLKLR